MIPKQVAATVCLHSTVRSLDGTYVLRALGAPVPERLENALARREHAAAGEVNLSLPDAEDEEAEEGEAELYELALHDEIIGEFEGAHSVLQEQQQADSRQYALQKPSAVLQQQLEAMKAP